MSSIDSTHGERLRRFFDEELLPRAEALGRRGVSLFPLAPGDECGESWWQPPPTWPDLATAEPTELARQLSQLWSEQDLPELDGLAAKLAELALELEQSEEQSADLSPYIYVMY